MAKKMATKNSNKVQEYRPPHPPYLGNVPKKHFFTASIRNTVQTKHLFPQEREQRRECA